MVSSGGKGDRSLMWSEHVISAIGVRGLMYSGLYPVADLSLAARCGAVRLQTNDGFQP